VGTIITFWNGKIRLQNRYHWVFKTNNKAIKSLSCPMHSPWVMSLMHHVKRIFDDLNIASKTPPKTKTISSPFHARSFHPFPFPPLKKHSFLLLFPFVHHVCCAASRHRTLSLSPFLLLLIPPNRGTFFGAFLSSACMHACMRTMRGSFFPEITLAFCFCVVLAHDGQDAVVRNKMRTQLTPGV